VFALVGGQTLKRAASIAEEPLVRLGAAQRRMRPPTEVEGQGMQSRHPPRSPSVLALRGGNDVEADPECAIILGVVYLNLIFQITPNPRISRWAWAFFAQPA
jgi:hypothetical protein